MRWQVFQVRLTTACRGNSPAGHRSLVLMVIGQADVGDLRACHRPGMCRNPGRTMLFEVDRRVAPKRSGRCWSTIGRCGSRSVWEAGSGSADQKRLIHVFVDGREPESILTEGIEAVATAAERRPVCTRADVAAYNATPDDLSLAIERIHRTGRRGGTHCHPARLTLEAAGSLYFVSHGHLNSRRGGAARPAPESTGPPTADTRRGPFENETPCRPTSRSAATRRDVVPSPIRLSRAACCRPRWRPR